MFAKRFKTSLLPLFAGFLLLFRSLISQEDALFFPKIVQYLSINQ